MGNKIQQGQIYNLIEDLEQISANIAETGSLLSDYVNTNVDLLETSIASTGTTLLARIASTGAQVAQYFVGKSGYAGTLYLNNTGWTGQLNGAPSNLQGLADFIDDITSLGGDNLGNHVATQNINLAGFSITGGNGDSLKLNTGNWTGNLLNATGTIAGLAKAVDLLVAAGGDNLGNHTATENLNLNSFDIIGADNITAAGDITGYRLYATLFLGNGDAITLDTGSFNGNLLGGGNSLLSLLNFIDNKNFGDDLGNHTATQNINLNSHSITGTGKVQTTTGSFQYLYSNSLYGDGSGIQVEDGKVRTGLLQGIDVNYNYLKNIIDRIDASGASILQITGDNLGNHKATGNLNLNQHSITGADSGIFNTIQTTYLGNEDIPVELLIANEINSSVQFTTNLYVYEDITGIGNAFFAGKITGTSGDFVRLDTQDIFAQRCDITDAIFETLTGDSANIDQLQVNKTISNSGIFNFLTGGQLIANTLVSEDYVYGVDIFGGNSVSAPFGTFDSLNNLSEINFSNGVSITGGTGDLIRISTGSWTGNLLGVDGTLLALANKIDVLSTSSNSSANSNQQNLSSVFNYMNLSKCFSTGAMGWSAEEEDILYFYSAAGYETSSLTMQSGTAWLDLAIPHGATGFAPTGCVDITFVADTGSSSFNKLDITFLTCSGNMTNNSTRFITGSWCPTGTTPQVFTLNSADLLNSSLSGHSRAKFKIEWYSVSGYSIKMINGAVNFVG